MRTIGAFGRQLDADRQYYIQKKQKKRAIWNAVVGTDRALLSSQTELFVYPNKYIKSLLFLKKTLAFLYFMVYTKKACDIDSYEA